MIFSEQWLREWIDPPVDTETLASQLTMAGLEVDAHNPVAADFQGVVVAEVLSVAPHPDAERLSVCEVSDGENRFSIVCGAPNVRQSLRVPLARIGADLPGESADKPFRICKAKLRGVESQGMLCSAEELGMAESADGLMELPGDAPLGQDLRHYLKLDDQAIELDLTPNRGDCLGIAGLAREIGVLNRMPVAEPVVPAVSPVIDDRFPVRIEAEDACPRYLGRIIRNIDPAAVTPLWMQERLRRSGLRSIDPLVDVTNHVLLELGQPMHAFDLARLEDGIVVRHARDGETLRLLDGRDIELQQDKLVIADASGPVALAGIMGGESTSVTDATRDVFLECAFFAPLSIAGKAREYGLHTDSSHRFERGVDPGLQHRAMERATELLLAIAGGEPGPVSESLGNLPVPSVIALAYDNVERLLGIRMEPAEIRDILVRLGLEVLDEQDSGLKLKVPGFRFDLSIEADLIEELARVYGYDRLPSKRSPVRLALGREEETAARPASIRQHMVSMGYQEVITYSFVEPELLARVNPEPKPIALQNPISSDMSVMRTSLWPGLLRSLEYNLNRQQSRMRLFEIGQVFLREPEETLQPTLIAGLLYGSRWPESWHADRDRLDFFDLKGDVEQLLSQARGLEAEIEFDVIDHPALHPGQSANLLHLGQVVGRLGTLHPHLQRTFDFPQPVYLFEFNYSLLDNGLLPSFEVISRYPEVSRDLAVVLDEQVPAAAIMAVIRENAGEFLEDLRIFDVYQGDALGEKKKSVALGLTWRHPSRTLGDDDINAVFSSCVKGLEEKFDAKLRN